MVCEDSHLYHNFVVSLEWCFHTIGSGIDGLEWNKVREIIQKVYADTDIEILVCYIE